MRHVAALNDGEGSGKGSQRWFWAPSSYPLSSQQAQLCISREQKVSIVTDRTFVLVKPDGVERALTGRIIQRFEDAGLEIVGLKMVTPTVDLATAHYPSTDEWFSTAGSKTLESYASQGLDAAADLGTSDPREIGVIIKSWLVEYLTSGPVVAMVLSGHDAVRNVRRLVGSTMPNVADPGSIRGAFSLDSATAANVERRPVLNLVHASGEPEEAEFEIGLWFGDSEG